jgi:hypothetical protein
MNIASADGTTIAFDQIGTGAPVILVCGGSTDRMANAALATVLASDAGQHGCHIHPACRRRTP